LQTQKRATVVGEPSWGGAHTIDGRRLDDRFMIVVPHQRAINPVTHTNWEGTGVVPEKDREVFSRPIPPIERLLMEELRR
jgi:C-terminal processing protease CtpA/Prc